MSSAAGNEQRFMAAVDGFGFAARDLEPVLGQLDAWLASLARELAACSLEPAGLQRGSELAQQALAINAGVRMGLQGWSEQRAGLAPAQSLAAAFEDQAMLLVFGKFNAGKSSLCNFLAGRFRRQGRPLQYFHLEGGQLREVPEALHEGATETTARLQGVSLGGRLVLLDTPGLHSATAANAALTQRFLDSADAVLWLTSSTSPGQVQELDALARELRRNKPLLPVVTRSDCIEEDEVDGEIAKLLRNKTAANRALQEADVQERAADKLRSLGVPAGLLKAPVSVSVRMAQAAQQGSADTAMADAGFERLYGALLELAAPALAYKQRKPAEMLLHHLEERVLGRLQAETLPALAALRRALQMEGGQLAQRQTRIVQAAWRSVVAELPQWLEQYAPAQDAEAVCDLAARAADAAFGQQLRQQLGGYVLQPAEPVQIVLGEGMAYEPVAASAGATVLAVGYERLHAALAAALQARLQERAAQALDACGAALRALDAGAERLQGGIRWHEEQLRAIKRALQAGGAGAGVGRSLW